MITLTATTNMHGWLSAGWTIVPGHVPGITIPQPTPPRSTAESLRDWGELETPLGGLEIIGSDEYEELLEDVALAQQAVEEYEAGGIVGTTPYSQYRSKRLGPES